MRVFGKLIFAFIARMFSGNLSKSTQYTYVSFELKVKQKDSDMKTLSTTKLDANSYRWTFVTKDVFGVNLCTLVQRNAWIHRQFALETFAATIRPRGVHLRHNTAST